MAFLIAVPAISTPATGGNGSVYVLVATIVLLLVVPLIFGFNSRKDVRPFQLRGLDAQQRAEIEARWSVVESNFRAHPLLSLREADRLVAELFGLRGLPSDGGEVGDRYRAAHGVVLEAAAGEAGDYRISEAMSDLRWVRDRLLEERTAQQPRRAGRPEVG